MIELPGDNRKMIARRILLVVILAGCSTGDRADGDDANDSDSTTATPIEEQPNTALPTSCDGLEHTILKVPATRAALHTEFGAPDIVVAVAQPNRHTPGVTDSIFSVFYPGLTVGVHMPGGGGDMPTNVSLEHNRYLAFPRIGIGAAVDSVVAALGPPTHRDAGSLLYNCSDVTDQPVRFELGDGRVRRIVIEYYVD